MKRVIDVIVDPGSLLELKPRYAKNLVTALARIDGRPVGVFATNPMVKGGALDGIITTRAASLVALEGAVERAQKAQRKLEVRRADLAATKKKLQGIMFGGGKRRRK